jgi:hypothetical protein
MSHVSFYKILGKIEGLVKENLSSAMLNTLKNKNLILNGFTFVILHEVILLGKQ